MEENTIEIKLVGDQPGTGGGGQPSPPVGSSQDVGPVAGGVNLRDNALLTELFGGDSSGETPVKTHRIEKDQERRNLEIQEEHDRRQMVQQGLQSQREAEARDQKREDDRVKREDDKRRKAEERELNADLKRQFREQEKERREDERQKKKEERELNADLKRQYREQQRGEKDAARAEKKAEQDAKDAEQSQRLKFIQAGQAVGQIAGSKTASGIGGGLINLADTGFLGQEAAAMAGGPAGGMVMAGLALYDAAKGMIQDLYGGYRENIQAAGNIGEAVINNDYGEAQAQATEAVAGFAEKTGLAGVVFAETLRTATAATQVFGQVVDAAAQRGRQLEQFNAGIAGASAQADVRAMQRDIAEAQRNEQSYSRIIDSQSRLQDAQRSIADPIKDAFLEGLADIIGPIADIMEDVRPVLKIFTQVIGFVIKVEAWVATAPLRSVSMIIDWVVNTFIPDWMKEDDVPNLFAEIDKAVENIRSGQAERKPADPDRVNRMKKPKFFGGQ